MKISLLTLFALTLCLPFANAKEGPKNRKIASIECPADGDELMKKVESLKTCYEASQVAENCAWGSSFDVGLAGAAGHICERDFKNINSKDKETLDYMAKRCEQKYAKTEGTLARSLSSFCRLSVDKFWSGIYSPVEN